jgi:SAM-dependent methyltransferase
VSRTLPNFATHDEDSKNHPIGAPIEPPEFIRRYLARQLQLRGGEPGRLRILDVGCGRGDTVAWLCAQGWDAHGIDVSADYLARGQGYLRDALGADPARLQLINADFSYPFKDAAFDIVLSDQVIEHVGDLDQFAAEVARVSAPGAVGMHIFPAKWRPVETHLLMPFAHWLPKGALRRGAVSGLLRAGVGAKYFQNLPHSDRAAIYNAFSEDETFYRSLRDTVATFHRHGLRCDARTPSREKIGFHLPSSPEAALPLLGWLYRNFASVVLYTEKP